SVNFARGRPRIHFRSADNGNPCAFVSKSNGHSLPNSSSGPSYNRHLVRKSIHRIDHESVCRSVKRFAPDFTGAPFLHRPRQGRICVPVALKRLTARAGAPNLPFSTGASEIRPYLCLTAHGAAGPLSSFSSWSLFLKVRILIPSICAVC